MIKEAQRLESVKEYYFSQKLQEIACMKTEEEIISLGIGSPDLQPHPSVLQAMIDATLSNHNGYQGYKGIPELRLSIARFYSGKYNVSLDYNTEILPLIGSKEGIMHISMAFLNEGDTVLIPNPGYPTYTSVTELVKAKPLYYDLKKENNWLPDFEQLEELATQRPKILWLNYPHMPTGANAGLETLEKLVRFAKKHDILLVNDNPYSFILNDNPISILSIEGAEETALELNSLSKTFNIAGWRVGMLLGNASLIQSVLKVKSNMDSGMNYAIQKAASVALNLSDEWYSELNETYAGRRELIWEIADSLGLEYDKKAAGMFVWCKLPDGQDDKLWIDEMLYGKKIFITPGSIFGSNGTGYVRFSLCCKEEKLIQVKNRLAN